MLDAEGRTIVDFWAPWCKPCDAIAPVLEAIAAEHWSGSSGRTSTSTSDVPSRYAVLSLPTVILFEDGEPLSTVVGARPRSHYERSWAAWLSPS